MRTYYFTEGKIKVSQFLIFNNQYICQVVTAHITDFNISFGHYPLPSLMPLLLIFTLLVIRVELYHNILVHIKWI